LHPTPISIEVGAFPRSQQRRQIETVRGQGQSGFLRVQRIEVLLYVIRHRNNQEPFAEPRGFIQGFESGGAGDAAARGHHPQKLASV
jgi:hypothetical protein